MQFSASGRFPHLLHSNYRPASPHTKADQAEELALQRGIHGDLLALTAFLGRIRPAAGAAF